MKKNLLLLMLSSINMISMAQYGFYQSNAGNARNLENFGASVSFSADGKILAVGSVKKFVTGSLSKPGSVFIYDRTTQPNNQDSFIRTTRLQLNPGLASDEDEFGASIALSTDGNTLVVGAPGKSLNASQNKEGAVFIYKRIFPHFWDLVAEINSSNNIAAEKFGINVGINGDGKTIAVVIPGKIVNNTFSKGNVVVFKNTTGNVWTNTAILNSNPTGPVDAFGPPISFSNDGTRIIAGTTPFAISNDQHGAAYIFKETNSIWTIDARLEDTALSISAQFGSGVAMSGNGNTVIVGAKKAGNALRFSAIKPGAAYVFVRNTSNGSWSRQARLLSNFDFSENLFGSSVSLSFDGNTAVVGAPGTGNTAAGHAGVFRRTGTLWQQDLIKLADPNLQGAERFGTGVAIAGNGSFICAGAPGWDASASSPDNGIMFIFKNNFVAGRNVFSGIENNGDFKLKVWPNPANDILHLSVAPIKQDEIFLKLYDKSGIVYKSMYITGKETALNISNLLPGVYYIEVKSASNTAIEKIIKQF